MGAKINKLGAKLGQNSETSLLSLSSSKCHWTVVKMSRMFISVTRYGNT